MKLTCHSLLLSSAYMLCVATAPARTIVSAAAAPQAESGTAEPEGGVSTASDATDPTTVDAELGSDESLVVEGSLFESATADESAATSVEGPVASRYSLGGYIRGDAFVGTDPGSNAPWMRSAYGETALQLRASGNSSGDGYAEVRLRYGLVGSERQALADLREAYVNAYLGPVDLRVGQQIIVWGRADAFNPTNNLTPLDLNYRSPVDDDRRVANFGLRGHWRWSPLRLEAVWLPLYRATQLPTVPLPEYVTETPLVGPAPALENSLVAGRLHWELASFEASASVLRGFAPLPGIALASFTTGQTPPSVVVTRRPYQQTVYGFDFATTAGDFGLRAEAAYRVPTLSSAVHAPRPDLQYVVGADTNLGAGNFILQYGGRYTLDWERYRHGTARVTALSSLVGDTARDVAQPQIESELRAANQMLFSQLARVQHLVTARAEWKLLHETLTLSALAMANATTEEWLAMPKARYQIADGLSTTMGAEYYAGPKDTGFGTIGELYSAAYAELRLSF